jgi:macrodomain Ter protein organizer (MatP/YcbG family)
VRRTQLYLDDHVWKELHSLARAKKTTISELVRAAVRDRYMGNLEKPAEAMRGLVGIRGDLACAINSVECVQRLRKGSRLERLHGK